MRLVSFRNAVSILSVILIMGCSEKTIVSIEMPLVEVYQIPEKVMRNVQKFPAIVQASNLTNLSFRVNGELIAIPVLSGQNVKEGTILAKVDPTNFKLAVEDKKSKVEIAKLSKNRAQKMVELGNMAQSIYDELEARFRIAQSEYELALLNLSYTELKAPFDGVIASVPADNFQNTAKGQLVATIHRTDKVEIKVELPDVILAAADTSNNKRDNIIINVSLDAYPDVVFKANYKEHTAKQSHENKTFMLILEMPIDEKRIALQGMPGSVEIDLSKLNMKKHEVSNVPVEAVTLPDRIAVDGNNNIIWRLNDDSTVTAIKVQSRGLASSSEMRVSGDLHPGDKIIVKGLIYLKDGLKVNVRPKGDFTR